MRILYLEDQPDAVENIPAYLRASGHSVVTVTSPGQAMKAFRGERFDLLLLDIMMKHGGEIGTDIPPHQTGLEFLRLIRNGSLPGGASVDSNLPVIIITAVGDMFAQAVMRNLGAEVLEKPVSAELDLRPLVERLVRSVGLDRGSH